MRKESSNVRTVNPNIFESDEVEISYRTINQMAAQRVGLVSLERIRILLDTCGEHFILFILYTVFSKLKKELTKTYLKVFTILQLFPSLLGFGFTMI